MNTSILLRTATAAALCLAANVSLADDRRAGRALPIRGYTGTTFVSFVDPNDPGFLQVRWTREGGLAPIGEVTAWTSDQRGNLATGEFSNHTTFVDDEGDELRTSTTGLSAFQPDGRITLQGTVTLLGGTGPYEHASGTLALDGWARITDPNTGAGIGFFTIDGTIHAKELKRWSPWTLTDSGIGQVQDLDFAYAGQGQSSGLGRFTSVIQSVAGPVNGFVGIINNKFTIVVPFEQSITARDGATLQSSGLEFVYFEILTLPDGSLAPDFTKPSIFESYSTVTGGTRRFEEAQGVLKHNGTLTPTSPTTVAATATARGFARIRGEARNH